MNLPRFPRANGHELPLLIEEKGERLLCWSSVLPWVSIPDHGIEDGKEFSHPRGQRELLGFSDGEQAAVEAGDDGIEARGDQGSDVERDFTADRSYQRALEANRK